MLFSLDEVLVLTPGAVLCRLVGCPLSSKKTPEFHAHTAEELALLPGCLTITKMLSDYAVIRDKAGMCNSFTATKTACFRRWPCIYPKERQKSWKFD